ncbi:protein white-like [Haliotis asinina]|uniref:protein white-like n=1 Tax=Haliotis asinina TaxID=109174 RepID=UPI0035320349
MHDTETVKLLNGQACYDRDLDSDLPSSEYSGSVSRRGEGFGGSYGTFGGASDPHSRQGMERISLTWENISVSVSMDKRRFFRQEKQTWNQKQILRNVTGAARPGTLLAIMGSSGAGKSTLMNVLTCRNTAQYITEGVVKVNGVDVGHGIKNISAYVQQDELFIGTLTVREHLTFRAMLRMDQTLSKSARLQRVEEVLLELGLSSCAETQIGTPGRTKGISGGEMKRLAFASEVLTNPPLMFCDEPTSSLDSFMAQNIVHILQNMTSKGRTILCTIHQPSSEVFSTFDQLLLLSEGRVAFMGSSSDALRFFESQGYSCPRNFNPADFYIHVLAGHSGEEGSCRDKVEKLCDAFRGSDICHQMTDNINDICRDVSENTALSVIIEDTNGNGRDRYHTSWIRQLTTLLWRSVICVYRDASLFSARLIQTVVVSLLLGLVYLDQKYDQKGVMNINGALFISIMMNSVTCMFAVVTTFTDEVSVFMREYGSGMYRTDVYFLSKTLAELPTFCAVPLIFVAIIYWMIGLYKDGMTFLMCAGTFILLCNVALSFGYMMSTASPSADIALAVTPPSLLSMVLFGGMFLNIASTPVYLLWLKYLSWYQYAFEIMTVVQWRNVEYLECQAGNRTAGNTTETRTRCFRDGKDVLDYLSFSEDNLMLDVILLVTLLVFYRLVAFLILLLKARRSRS